MLFIQVVYLLKNPTPESRFIKLAYLNKQWVLWQKEGSTLEYTHHRVLFEAGLFFILHLSKESSQKRLVIFFDQIRPENYRVLRILEAIN